MATRSPRAVLAAILFLPVGLIAQEAAAPKLQKDRVEALAQRAFEKFAPKGLALAVVVDGEVVCELGLGEREAGKPVTPHTLFNIASCSKAFTAALVAQQVTLGKLGWNDRVVDHVPAFRMADPWITAHMTIADLLSHRCGLETFAGDLLWYGTDRDDAQVLARIEKLPIKQRFREQFGYQNLMYMVAGLVLQNATGASWDELVETRLMKPLGMGASRACRERLPGDAEVAHPFIDGEEVPDFVYHACKPAASIYASVHDLTAWVRMLVGGGAVAGKPLLAPQALAELWRPHVGLGGGAGAGTADFGGYGMGWFLRAEAGQKLVEHDGGMPGFLSKVTLLPAERFGFVVLNNANDGIVNEALKRALLAARRGGDGLAEIDRLAEVGKRVAAQAKSAKARREATRVPETKPTLALAAYVGAYEDAVCGPAEITLAGDELHFALVPAKARMSGKLVHWHHDVFRVDFPDRFLPFALVSFELDPAGKVAGFRIECPIADFDFGALDYRRTATK